MEPTRAVAGTAARPLVLPAWRPRAVSVQFVSLVAASVLLPAAAHLLGLPVRHLLPMHWPVLFVGLCYGWPAGLVVGLLAPALSHLLSGMPYAHILPSMTVELATYGVLAGWLRGSLQRGRWTALLLALLGGRLVFVLFAAATGAIAVPLTDYLPAALVPGLPAALAQLLLLPPLAGWWVRHEQRARS